MEPRPGAVLAGKFELIQELGRGSMGTVWRARDRLLRRDVAVKLIHADLGNADEGDRSLRASFEREARAAASLRTRHVTQVLELGFERATPFIVMELLLGESLSQRLGRVHRLSLGETVALGVETCRGLQQAHDAGIVHRDLKPGNLFLAREDGVDVTKILDFGIAKVRPGGVSEVHTATGATMGTPHYMSPEQIRGDRVDARSDLWSLAVILYRCLAGVRPFEGQTLGDVVSGICHDPPPPIRTVAPDLPVEVEAFFALALVREVDRRFPSAVDLGRALSALPTGHPAVRVGDPGMGGLRAPAPESLDAPTFSDLELTRRAPTTAPRLGGSTPGPHLGRPPSAVPEQTLRKGSDARTLKLAALTGVVLGGLLLAGMLVVMKLVSSPPASSRPAEPTPASSAELPAKPRSPADHR